MVGLLAFGALAFAAAPVLRLSGGGSDATYANTSAPESASTSPPSPSAPPPPPSPPSNTAPSPATGSAYATSVYSLTVPAGWIRDRDETTFPGFVSSQWHLKGRPDVYMKVDYTPGSDATAAEGARSVRNLYPGRVSGYREISWAAIHISGHSSWRWHFRLDKKEIEKVDWFFGECSTGLALLGAAPPDVFQDYLPTFQEAVKSLTFACE